MATSRFSFVSRGPIDLAHAAGAEGGEDFVRAEAGAGGQGQQVHVDYTSAARTADGITLDRCGRVFRSRIEPVEITGREELTVSRASYVAHLMNLRCHRLAVRVC